MRKILCLFLVATLFFAPLNAEDVQPKESIHTEDGFSLQTLVKAPLYVVIGACGVVYYGTLLAVYPFAYLGNEIKEAVFGGSNDEK